MKRKMRQADNIMVSHNANDFGEGSQLIEEADHTPLKLRDKFALNDSDDGEPSSNKKLLLNESDFELNEKKRTPGHLMMSGSNKQRIQDMSDLFPDGEGVD